MDLIVDNKVILTPIKDIVSNLQQQVLPVTGKLKDVKVKTDNIVVTCPNNTHKNGLENRPSCNIYNSNNNDKVALGTVHCFSCGYKANFIKFIADSFNKNIEFAKQWLLENSDYTFVSYSTYLPEIEINKTITSPISTLDESILKNYEYYHKYMWQRNLKKEVVDLFEVGYDPKTDCLTFPVRNEKGQLVCVTKRSVKSKYFEIPSNIQKPVYLLYYILKKQLNYCAVTEAQIDALTLWSYNIPAVATVGQISEEQISTLNKSGITTFITFFDNDAAGDKFTKYFNNHMRKDVFIYNLKVPYPYKDVNDVKQETIYKIFKENNLNPLDFICNLT